LIPNQLNQIHAQPPKTAAVANITYVVRSMSDLVEIKNTRNLMKHLHKASKISNAEHRAWKKKQIRIKQSPGSQPKKIASLKMAIEVRRRGG
jgi:hypothetical protein